jgi:signal transduction histidine kinase
MFRCLEQVGADRTPVFAGLDDSTLLAQNLDGEVIRWNHSVVGESQNGMAEPVPDVYRDLDEYDDEISSADASTLLPTHVGVTQANVIRDVGRVQIAQTVRSIPLLVLFHASAGLCLNQLIAPVLPDMLLQLLQIAAIFVGIGFGVIFFGWRSGRWRNRPDMVIQALSGLSLALGLVWGVPAAFAAQFNDPAAAFPVLGLCLCMTGIGAVSLIRLPMGAIVFIAVVTAAMARSFYWVLPLNQMLAALVAAIYGLALGAIVLINQRDFLRRTAAEFENARQKQVIKLLLNDFERDASDWLWESNAHGLLTYCSPRFAEVVGRDMPEMLGSTMQELLAPHMAPVDWARLELSFVKPEGFSAIGFDITLIGQKMHWQMLAHGLQDEAGRFAGHRGVGRDMTEQREAQMRMERAMDASEKASAAKSQFLAIVSHELRTPINAIVGFSELLARDLDGSLTVASRREYSSTILDSAHHLQSLINDLLDATRIERGSVRLIEQDNDAAELAESAIKMCNDVAEKSEVQIVGRLTDYITLKGDLTRLKQVMVNLLANAVKFSPSGGIVNVEMQKGREGQFVLAIRDAGIGIPQSELESVFDPFKQVEGSFTRQYGGLGLGLSIARRLAQLHDGDVRLESAVGAGTTALFIIPAERVVWPKQIEIKKQSVA